MTESVHIELIICLYHILIFKECDFLNVVYGDHGNITILGYSQDSDITKENYILLKDIVTCQKNVVVLFSVKESTQLDNKIFFNICLRETGNASGRYLHSNDYSEMSRVGHFIMGRGYLGAIFNSLDQ